MADRKVRFRRIGGRVVPIRSKRKGSPSHKVAAVGVGALAGGKGLQVYSLKKISGLDAWSKPVSTYSLSSPPYVEREFVKIKTDHPQVFNSKWVDKKMPGGRYGRLLKRWGVKTVIDPTPFSDPLQGAYYPGDKAFKFGEEVPAEIFEHELGHAKAVRRRWSFNRLQNKIIGKIKNPKIGRAYNATIKPFINLGSEAEASIEAMKFVKKRLGKDTAGIRKARRALGFAYGSYLGSAIKKAGVGLIGVAALMKAREAMIKRRNK